MVRKGKTTKPRCKNYCDCHFPHTRDCNVVSVEIRIVAADSPISGRMNIATYRVVGAYREREGKQVTHCIVQKKLENWDSRMPLSLNWPPAPTRNTPPRSRTERTLEVFEPASCPGGTKQALAFLAAAQRRRFTRPDSFIAITLPVSQFCILLYHYIFIP